MPAYLSSAPDSITGCVSFGSFLNLSGPQRLQLKMETVIVSTSIGQGGSERVPAQKVLRTAPGTCVSGQ